MFDVVVESAGAYPLVTHSLTAALRGAIAVLVASPDAKSQATHADGAVEDQRATD